MKPCLLLIAGGLFGAGLVISGMTDPARVIGFLDFAGDWNPALAFVMFGAVTAFGLGQSILRKNRIRLFATDLPDTSASPVSKRMLVGSAIFGIGWGLSGICPGPALANLPELHREILVFTPLMLAGMAAAQRLFDLDR